MCLHPVTGRGGDFYEAGASNYRDRLCGHHDHCALSEPRGRGDLADGVGVQYVNEIHIHFRTVVYSSLSVYFDTNANGAYEASEKLLKPIRGIESGLHDAIIGLMLLGAATAIKLALGTTLLGAILLVALDAFALYKELSGLGDVIAITGRGGNLVRGAYPFLYPVTLALNVVGIATTASDLAGDSAVFAKKLTGG